MADTISSSTFVKIVKMLKMADEDDCDLHNGKFHYCSYALDCASAGCCEPDDVDADDEPVSSTAPQAAEACKIRIAANAALERAIQATKLVSDIDSKNYYLFDADMNAAQQNACAAVQNLTDVWLTASNMTVKALADARVADRNCIAIALLQAVRDRTTFTLPEGIDVASTQAVKLAELLMKTQ